MSRFSMVLLILALLAAGGTTSGIDLAFAKSVGTPGLTQGARQSGAAAPEGSNYPHAEKGCRRTG